MYLLHHLLVAVREDLVDNIDNNDTEFDIIDHHCLASDENLTNSWMLQIDVNSLRISNPD